MVFSTLFHLNYVNLIWNISYLDKNNSNLSHLIFVKVCTSCVGSLNQVFTKPSNPPAPLLLIYRF